MSDSLKRWLLIIGGAVILLAVDNFIVFRYMISGSPNPSLNSAPSPTNNIPSLLSVNNTTTTDQLPSLTQPLSTSTCVVLPEQFCKTGRLIGYPIGYGHDSNLTHAAFNVPTGTKVFSPFDTVVINHPQIYTTIGGQKYEIMGLWSNDGRYYASIVAKLDKINFGGVKKGGYIGEVGGQKISAAGDYNLTITFFDVNSPTNKSDVIHDLSLTKQYFPNL